MVARGYVDDAAFAQHWVTTRAPRGYGGARLRAELRARGVASGLIDRALATLEDDPALEGDVALERARALARRRWPALRRAAPDRAAARLRAHLLRRGYAAGIVGRVVREVTRAPLDD